MSSKHIDGLREAMQASTQASLILVELVEYLDIQDAGQPIDKTAIAVLKRAIQFTSNWDQFSGLDRAREDMLRLVKRIDDAAESITNGEAKHTIFQINRRAVNLMRLAKALIESPHDTRH